MIGTLQVRSRNRQEGSLQKSEKQEKREKNAAPLHKPRAKRYHYDMDTELLKTVAANARQPRRLGVRMRSLNIRLPDATNKRLAAFAKLHRMKKAAIVVGLIEVHIPKEPTL